MFVKLTENNGIICCPNCGFSETDGRYHTNLPCFYKQNIDIAHADGYYILIETDPPEQEGYYAVPTYILEGEFIVQHWTLIPDDPVVEE